jgi:hypothetical protein
MSRKQHYKSKQGKEYDIHGGVYTGYSFTPKDGEKSVLGFDHPEDVKSYIEKRENGNPHFCDDLSDIKKD